MNSKDHFSLQAADYARYRPDYPQQLFQSLAGLCEHRDLAWDCGTGNGQAAARLAELFTRVLATDISAEQLGRARQKSNIEYRLAPAEESRLATHSVDLIVVAQALHWFNIEAFYKEARRVLKNNAVLAVISYGLPRVTPEVDEIVDYFYGDIIGDYWPPERIHVDSGYSNIPFPLQQLEPETPPLEHEWALEQFLGYLRSWSAVTRFQKAKQEDPLLLIKSQLAAAWPKHDPASRIRWPLTVLAGRFDTRST